MSAVYKRGRAELAANFTPMIDVAFLLIVFFVLVSRVVDMENVQIALPAPHPSATTTIIGEERIVINVRAVGERAAGYQVGPRLFLPDDAGCAALTEHMAALYRANPSVSVNVRADAAIRYDDIEPLLQAVSLGALRAELGDFVPRINLVVNKAEETR